MVCCCMSSINLHADLYWVRILVCILILHWETQRQTKLYRMGSVNLVVIVESLRSIITKRGDSLDAFDIPSIVAVAAALG
jgi:hypothetical protein